jgi:hypothetical protein
MSYKKTKAQSLPLYALSFVLKKLITNDYRLFLTFIIDN